jgi:hypothetical protein
VVRVLVTFNIASSAPVCRADKKYERSYPADNSRANEQSRQRGDSHKDGTRHCIDEVMKAPCHQRPIDENGQRVANSTWSGTRTAMK